MIFLKD
jgi:hypothetical protein